MVPLEWQRDREGDPSNAPECHVVDDGAPAAVTIDSSGWPCATLLLRGCASVDRAHGATAEHRDAAVRYPGDAQGDGWCDQLPPGLEMLRVRVAPRSVGLLDVDEMRRVPSALAG